MQEERVELLRMGIGSWPEVMIYVLYRKTLFNQTLKRADNSNQIKKILEATIGQEHEQDHPESLAKRRCLVSFNIISLPLADTSHA